MDGFYTILKPGHVKQGGNIKLRVEQMRQECYSILCQAIDELWELCDRFPIPKGSEDLMVITAEMNKVGEAENKLLVEVMTLLGYVDKEVRPVVTSVEGCDFFIISGSLKSEYCRQVVTLRRFNNTSECGYKVDHDKLLNNYSQVPDFILAVSGTRVNFVSTTECKLEPPMSTLSNFPLTRSSTDDDNRLRETEDVFADAGDLRTNDLLVIFCQYLCIFISRFLLDIYVHRIISSLFLLSYPSHHSSH